MEAIGFTYSEVFVLLRHIRYFLAVAEQGNFTRAAEVLHVSQPTLSQQIKQLEASLNAQLFDRSGRTVTLTDAGVAWKHYAERALRTCRPARGRFMMRKIYSRGRCVWR